MAFVYAYNLPATGFGVVVDLPLETLTNYKNAVGTNGFTKGDAVTTVAGLLKRSKDDATANKITGVLEGIEFLGLADGGTYAATNASFNASAIDTTAFPNGVGKVRMDSNAVYRVPVKAGQTAANANLQVSYGLSQDAAGDQTVDLTNITTNVKVKVIGFTKDGKSVFVTLL